MTTTIRFNQAGPDAWKNAPVGTPEFYARWIAASLIAYEEPVPPSGLSIPERNRIALEGGARWAAKGRNNSCAWHEISESLGTLATCPCRPCRIARGENRP